MKPLPDYVLQCLSVFFEAGVEAFLVGGCVRDLLLGRTPQDYDIASAAPPERVMELFDHVVPTGLRHGTVTVLLKEGAVEITQFRMDGEYKDHRRPDTVRPASTIVEDLSRRDFTINAMALGPKGLVDPFGGLADCRARIIRAVGDPSRRFSEDALRILRAYRFACQLAFTIEADTKAAAFPLFPLLAHISRERIYAELSKALSGSCPSRLTPFLKAGPLAFAGLPPLTRPYPDGLPAFLPVRIAALCFLCGCSAQSFCAAMRCDKATARESRAAEDFLLSPLPASSAGWRRALSAFTKEELERWLAAREILTGESSAMALQRLRKTADAQPPVHMRDLAITGEDLLALGYTGPAVGKILRGLLEAVWESPGLNQKSRLLELARQWGR